MKLGEYLNAINHSKKPLMDTEDEQVEKQYTPFVVNRCLSYFIDTVLHSNLMNEHPEISSKMQYSDTKAKEISDILTTEEIEEIRQYLHHGG